MMPNVLLYSSTPSSHGEQQRKCVFSSRNRISAGGIQHDNATARRRLNIHIVHPHPGAAYHTKFRAGIQNVRGDSCLTAHDYRAEWRDNLDQFCFAQPGLDRHIKLVAA